MRRRKWDWRSHLTPDEAALIARADAAAAPINTLADHWESTFAADCHAIAARATRRARSAARREARRRADPVRAAAEHLLCCRAAAAARNGDALDKLVDGYCIELAEQALQDAIAEAERRAA